jgi:hypothetical protein
VDQRAPARRRRGCRRVRGVEGLLRRRQSGRVASLSFAPLRFRVGSASLAFPPRRTTTEHGGIERLFAQRYAISDVCVLCRDIETSIRFYVDKLGFAGSTAPKASPTSPAPA